MYVVRTVGVFNSKVGSATVRTTKKLLRTRIGGENCDSNERMTGIVQSPKEINPTLVGKPHLGGRKRPAFAAVSR